MLLYFQQRERKLKMGRKVTVIKNKKNCLMCGKEFLCYGDKKKYCSPNCYHAAPSKRKGKGKEKEKRECPICHDLFEVTFVRTKHCSNKCRYIAHRKNPLMAIINTPHIPIVKICLDCGIEFTVKTNETRCSSCQEISRKKWAREYAKEYSKTDKWKTVHNIHAINWQHKNKKKVQAASRAKGHSEWVTVLYECPCDYPNKYNHHPDYKKVFDVYKLCPACHSAEHVRLRSLLNQQPAITAA